MSTYGELHTQITDDLNRDNYSAQIALAIKNAIRYYDQRGRFWFQEERKTAVVVDTTDLYALPSDFNSEDMVSITEDSDTWVLTPKDQSYIEERQNPDHASRPMYYVIYDEQIRLYPWPDGSYTLTLHYHKQLGDFTATSSFTDGWFTDGYELIRFRAMYDVAFNSIHDYDLAKGLKEQELEQFAVLQIRNNRYTRSGRLTRHF